jgi:hypothetical protein
MKVKKFGAQINVSWYIVESSCSGQMPVTNCSGVSSMDSDPVGIGPIFMDKEERDFDTLLLQHDMFRGGSYLGAFLALENLRH